jgi:small subunit ribosomal protein S16
MPVRVRLTRVGSKKNPIWRVVVADGRSPRDGRFIETVGHYNPQTQPSTIVLDHERLQHWIDRGAQPSGTVKKLMRSGSAEPAAEPAEPAADQPAEPAADAS